MLARFLKLGWLPEVAVPTDEVQQLRHLFKAREGMAGMLTRLKNKAHAALVRSGHAHGSAAFKFGWSRSKVRSPGLSRR